MNKYREIVKYSNPQIVFKKGNKYIGKSYRIKLSSRKDKKYMILTPTGKIVHFGQMGYEDYTKHKDKTRRKNYLNRSKKIRGDWIKNKYSANNLSRNILW
jgi:hypothetical protein